MLLEVRGKDFCCFGEFKLRLAGQGLVWVGGANHDTEAADNNGCGKSTLFKAITWCLYGDTIDGERGDKVIRDGARSCWVEVSLEGGWLVRRERKKGAPKLILTKDGEPWKGDRKAIQGRIIDLLGLDFQAFKNTVLYGQNDSARFADPRVTDSARKDMLHRITRSEVLRVAHKEALEQRTALRNALSKMESRLGALISARDSAKERAKSLKQRATDWEGDRGARVEAATLEAREHRDRARKMLRDAPDAEALREEQARLQADIEAAEAASEAADRAEAKVREAREIVSKMRADRAVMVRDIEHVEEHLAQLGGDNCPTCGADLKDSSGRAVVEDIEGKRDLARDNLRALDEEVERAKSLVERREAARDSERKKARLAVPLRASLADVQARLHHAENATERAREVAERAKAALKRAKAIEAEDNPHRDMFATARKEYLEAREQAVELKAKVEAQHLELAVVEFWVRGFGAQGLPSYILDSVMPYITTRTNHYLEVLSDGDITMEFSTQRELKSAKGEYRDEIDITWSIEGADDYPPSGGQQRKMEISTDLALMDLTETREGAGLNLFIADEILDGLDSEGTDRVLRLLHELRAKRGSIFVISHKPSMSEVFEKSIRIVKDGGVSRLEVAA